MEVQYREELEALASQDTARKPIGWKLSPQAVRTFILGSKKPIPYGDGEITIQKKYYGNDALIERCIVTLAGNRGLMLVGEPGTAKSMLSELLSAAISGVSTNTIQGTAGTTEDMIKYSWNYAMLLDRGPVKEALVPSPLYVGMEKGILTRFEEITRTPAQIQDSLISVLSDKVLNVPELGDGGLASELRQQFLLRAQRAVGGVAYRAAYADGGVVAQVAPDLADYHRHRVGREAYPVRGVEVVYCLYQPDAADLE